MKHKKDPRSDNYCCVFSNCDNAMKNSLVVALRNSQEQAQKTFECRIASQKRHLLFNFLPLGTIAQRV